MRRVVFAVCALALFPAAGKAASFDCDKAHSPVEKTICADDYLSSLDSETARFYRLAQARPDLLADQRQWNKDNAAHCFPADDNAAKKCLVKRYEDRRLVLLGIVRREAAAKARATRVGPYAFQMVTIDFSKDRTVAYPLLADRPASVAEAFDALVEPSDKEFLNYCEEQSLKVEIEKASDRIVTVRTETWMFCDGAAHGYGSAGDRSILMYPTPHWVAPEDLFRPGTPWRKVLGDKSVGAAGGAELTPEQEQEVRQAAAEPRNWSVTPAGLTIGLGWLNGYVGGQADAEIAWDTLRDLLVADPPVAPQ